MPGRFPSATQLFLGTEDSCELSRGIGLWFRDVVRFPLLRFENHSAPQVRNASVSQGIYEIVLIGAWFPWARGGSVSAHKLPSMVNALRRSPPTSHPAVMRQRAK